MSCVLLFFRSVAAETKLSARSVIRLALLELLTTLAMFVARIRILVMRGAVTVTTSLAALLTSRC